MKVEEVSFITANYYFFWNSQLNDFNKLHRYLKTSILSYFQNNKNIHRVTPFFYTRFVHGILGVF
jgi:hypothetical protein